MGNIVILHVTEEDQGTQRAKAVCLRSHRQVDLGFGPGNLALESV